MEKKLRKEYSNSYQSMAAIRNVLRQYSSEEHPLAVDEIYKILERTEELPPSKATVEKRLRGVLTYGGTDIYQLCCVARRRGRDGELRTVPYGDVEAYSTDDKNNVRRLYYLEGHLTQGAWRFLSDLVRDHPYITHAQTRQILDALDLLVQPKRPRVLEQGDKPDWSELLSIVEKIDRAIRERKKLLVAVGEYALELRGGRRIPVLRPGEEMELVPYTLVWSGGHYWLVGRGQESVALRLDRLLWAEMLEETVEAPDPAAYRADIPPTDSGGRAVVRLRCAHELLGDVADLLGPGAQYSAPGADGTFEVIAPAALERLKPFALRWPDRVEVLEPESLRRDILGILRQGVARYGS